MQISGPTAAFATIVAGIVATDGINGLVAATLIAGVLLVLMGLLKLGTIIRFVPYTITTGFTAGIAVTIVIGQLKDFFGLTYPAGTATVETLDKVTALAANFGTFNWQALVVGAVCLAVLFLWPRLGAMGAKVPSSLVAVIVGMIMVPPVRHEREHNRRFVHHQRRLARAARAAALNRFATRPAS